MKRTVGLFTALLALLLIAMPVAKAYDLKPIVVQLAPSGSGSSQVMIITNTHKVPIAIEVRAFKREQNPDGTEKRTPEDNDILISPPQMVIPPNASQSFKVRWVGEANPSTEIPYRLITTQLPIKFKNEQTGDVRANVSVGYRYEAALYIVPPKSSPKATLTEVAPVRDDEGKLWLQAKIMSEGTRRAILKKPVLTVTRQNGGEPIKMEGEQLAALENLNILVGNERVVRLPWPEGLAEGPVTASFETDYTIFN